MNQKDYHRKRELLVSERDSLNEEISAMDLLFKQKCPHVERHLVDHQNGYHDEYGSWTNYVDYNYTCTRCGTTLFCVDKFDNIASLREALKIKARLG